MNSNIPVLLLPLKIETRFIDATQELWIRVFPDEIFMENHSPILNEREREDATTFKNLKDLEDKKKYWHQLVKKYGAFRAAWLVDIQENQLENQTGDNDHSEKTYRFNWLPDRLYFYIYYKNEAGKTKLLVDIGGDIPEEGLVAFGENDEWVNDFQLAASDFGMAKKISYAQIENSKHIEKIIVTGIRGEDSSAKGDNIEVKALLENHKYSNGLSFLEYGSPTNNVDSERSAHSIKDKFESIDSYNFSVEGHLNTPDKTSSGFLLSSSLGLKDSELSNLKNADHRETDLNTSYKASTWYATGGNTLDMLFGNEMSSDTQGKLWMHYYQYVNAKGPLPSIKIGKQPYGVLPIMSFHNNTIESSDSFVKEIYPILKKLFSQWKSFIDVVPVMKPFNHTTEEGGEYNPDKENKDLLEILSMQEYSTDYELLCQKYERTSSKFPGSWVREKGISTSLPSLPLGLLYDLLNDYPQIKVLLKYIEDNREKYSFLHNVISEAAKNRLNFSPNLSFKNDDSIPSYQLNNKEESIVKLTQKDFSELNKIVQQIKDENSETSTEKKVLNYETDKELSVFVDLFLRGYANAIKPYYKIEYFQPTKDQLKDYDKFEVSAITNKGVEISDGTKKMTIEFSLIGGKKTYTYVTIGQQVEFGQKLFVVKGESSINFITTFFVGFGETIINALKDLPEDKSKVLQMEALREVIDLNSYRIDAWITSLATRQLSAIRVQTAYKNKIALGAYGWVEDLKMNSKPVEKINGILSDNITRSDGGIIHCPTPAQSLVSTVFKNSFLNHVSEEGDFIPNPFALNLFSDRIQKSGQLMEGIRQDQSVEALLGYRLERYLHENQKDILIYDLRKAFPLEVNIINRDESGDDIGFKTLSVIDGLKIIDAKNNNPLAEIINDETLKIGIGHLEDILDGSMDSLFFEAGYQLLHGNLDRSAAAMDASLGKIDPPEIESLKTRIPGIGIKHKMGMIFKPVEKNFIKTNVKAFAEPVIESWLEEQLGSMEKIACLVELYLGSEVYDKKNSVTPEEIVEVKLSQLGLNYSDLLYLSETPISDGVGELELRIYSQTKKNATKKLDWENITFKITTQTPKNHKSLFAALEWARYTLSFFSRCRYLKSDDLNDTNGTNILDGKELIQIKKRITTLIKQVDNWKPNKSKNIEKLAQFDFQEAKRPFLNQEEIDEKALDSEINNKLDAAEVQLALFDETDLSSAYYKAFDYLKKSLNILLGESYILLPPAIPSKSFIDINNNYNSKKLVGDSSMNLNMTLGEARIQNWVEEIAQVKKGAEVFEEWQMVDHAWNDRVSDFEYHIYQTPTGNEYPWVGLSIEEITELKSKISYPSIGEDKHYPNGSESCVFYAPSGIKFSSNGTKPVLQYGFIIEEFSEHIPDKEMSTGLSFHYNGPNSEPPQSLLIAVKPLKLNDNSAWSPHDLALAISDTLDLAKIRMVDKKVIKDKIEELKSTNPEEANKLDFVLPMINWIDVPTIN